MNPIIDHTKGGSKMELPSKGGIQETTIIPESDVYRLIMRSKLPEAEQFQDWVCEEVLPSSDSLRGEGVAGPGPHLRDPARHGRHTVVVAELE